MMLSDCLSANQSILGSNCEQLGKNSNGFGFFNQKKLLSYAGKDRWNVVSLNVFQLFFRKILGFYKSTHLDYVTKRISELQPSNNTKNCCARIKSLWMKKNLIGLGNSELSKADVLGFAETHLDKRYSACVAQLVNDNYQRGDVILVEGLKAGEKMKAQDHPQTKHLKLGCVVRGWEPKNFEEMHRSVLEKPNSKAREMQKCFEFAWSHFGLHGSLTDRKIAKLGDKLNELIKKVNDLNKYYKSDSKLVVQADKILKEAFEKLKKRDLSSDSFYAVILKVFSELQKKQAKVFYKNITWNDRFKIADGIPVRNASLANEINMQQTRGRKVFVFAGKDHLLKRWYSDKSIEKVKEILSKCRFVIITRKTLFAGNADLKKIAL
ncbi:MAG: hypothetical protein V4494_05375 [Chlamydiota bacterium]